MGAELRWENLKGTVADGTTSSHSVSEFRNDSARTLHIRSLNCVLTYAAHEAEESGIFELSKSPTQSALVNNGVFFSWAHAIGGEGGTTGAAVDDVTSRRNFGTKFGRGQLTLEPNESLFVNVTKSSGGAADFIYHIGYHY